MKALFTLITIACLTLTSRCGAQTNLPLTNHILINEFGVRLSVVSPESLGRNDLVGDQQVLADGQVFWVLDNTSTNRIGAMLPREHKFSVELKTLGGVSIPRTELCENLSQPPNSLKDSSTARSKASLPGSSFLGDLPPLTKLFRFPSNGVYVLEFRVWAWQRSKKSFALSDPVRVRVVKDDPSKGGSRDTRDGPTAPSVLRLWRTW